MPNELTVGVTGELTDVLRDDLALCWMDVANSGGAVGFPFIPVPRGVVLKAVDRLSAEVERGDVVVVQARLAGVLVGWVTLRLNRSTLTAHWATIERLQSHPTYRGSGVGAALLLFATAHACDMGLEQLRLVLRGGERLESFYEAHGWTEIGRHRNALRLKDGDDRDEVFMAIELQSI